MKDFSYGKNIKDLGLLDTFNGDEKLYMENEDAELEEVNMPLEYFTESALISTAVVKLIRKYGKDSFIASRPVKVMGFKISKDDNGKPYLEFECLEQCEERAPEESDMEYKEKLTQYERKLNKGIIRPYKVLITESVVNEKGLKIKAENFIKEIDKLLDDKILEESEKINAQLKGHEITREEWLEKMADMRSKIPASALEYMKDKMEQVKKYREYITSFDEYQEMLGPETMITHIAQEAGLSHSRRYPIDREPMHKAEEVPFSEREEFMKSFKPEKVIEISTKKGEAPVYKAYVFNDEKEDGKVIVLEPIDGDKTTFVTFQSDEDIEKRKAELGAEKDEKVSRTDVYKHTVASVLGKGWSEKVDDKSIINKYHVSSYKRDMQFLITGNRERKSRVPTGIVNKRDSMVK